MNGKAASTRTRLERGRSALGPALELVHTGRAPTRAVLTAELGVTRATAGAVAAELEALGLIRVDARPGAAAGSQGRPSHRLAVAEDGPVALAAQIHADGFRAALVGLGGRIVATAPGCEVVDEDPAKVLGSVVEAGAALLAETGRRCVVMLSNDVRAERIHPSWRGACWARPCCPTCAWSRWTNRSCWARRRRKARKGRGCPTGGPTRGMS